MQQPTSDFDLEYVLAVGDEFRLCKNGRFRNVYEDDFEEVPIKTEEEEQEDFQVDEEFVEETVLQYVSGIFIPPSPPKPDNTLPDITLEPVFVNGFAGLESTQNVFFVDGSNIVFSAATVGIVMNTQSRQQRFFGAIGQIDNTNAAYEKYHKTSIVSICHDRDSGLVATGSLGGSPEICVWKVEGLQPISKFYQGKGTKAVSIIKFLGKEHLVTVDRESRKSNNLNIWTVEGKKKVSAKCPGSVYSVSVDGQSRRIAIASSKGAFLSEYDEGADLTIVCYNSEYSTSAAHCLGKPLFGRPDGTILYSTQTKKVHKGCIFAITTSKDGLIYSSGGEDKLLKISNHELKELRQIQLEQYARSIDLFKSSILLGLRNGKIIQIEEDGTTNTHMNCHFAGETYGLCYDSYSETLISAGDDNKILTFSLEKMAVTQDYPVSLEDKQNKKYQRNKLNQFSSSKQCRAVAASKDLFAYSNNYGKLYLSRRSRPTQPWEAHKLGDLAQCVMFSADGKLLVAGCNDDCIYLFNIDTTRPDKQVLQLKAVLFGHESDVVSFDFSSDQTYLRSVGSSGELRYWDLTKNQEILMTSNKRTKQQKDPIKQAKWQSVGKFCYQTHQIWDEIKSVEYINVIKNSFSGRYLAVGEDDNCVRLYRSPSVKGKFRRFHVHGGNVVNLCWVSKDKYLASVGMADRCMIIWRVVQA